MIHNEQRDELLKLASKFESAMLVTHGLDGQLQARPMMIAKLEPSGDLWFVSDRNSGKIDEIMHTQRNTGLTQARVASSIFSKQPKPTCRETVLTEWIPSNILILIFEETMLSFWFTQPFALPTLR